MTISAPLWCQGATYLAKVDRNLFAQLWDEGVLTRRAFKVTQRAAGANLSVDVAAGNCVVTGDDQSLQGNYLVQSDADANVTGYVAPGSNSRYDLVGVQINDPDAGGAAGNSATIIRVPGTAAAVPVIPALPNSFLLLAIVGPILPATTSITNAMIHDVWTGTGPTGVAGARLLAGNRDRPGTSKDTWNGVADNGWLLENGAAVSRTVYADLFEHLGTTHGVGDGVSTFNLPFSNGRAAVAADVMGGVDAGLLSSSNTIGTKMGAETHTLTQAELPAATITIDPPSTAISAATSTSVTIIDPTHAHPTLVEAANPNILQFPVSGASGVGWTSPGNTGAAATGITATAASTTTGTVDIGSFASGNLGSGTAHSIVQPSITVYRMIRT